MHSSQLSISHSLPISARYAVIVIEFIEFVI